MSLGSIPSWPISELQFFAAAPLGFMLTLVGALMPDASVPLCPMLAYTFFSFDLADVSAQCCGLGPPRVWVHSRDCLRFQPVNLGESVWGDMLPVRGACYF